MDTLYKRFKNRIEYWEARKHGRKIVIHWGQLGERGNTQVIAAAPGKKAERIIAAKARMLRALGFKEIAPEKHQELVVQYRTKGWGSGKDLAKRHKVEDLINECLGWTENGHCDGGDIGSGTINIYCLVVDPHLAASAIIAALKDARLLRGAVIACATDDDEYAVLWPKDHKTRFEIFYEENKRSGPGMLVPPWVMFQDLSPRSERWREKEPAAYLARWSEWFRSMPNKARAQYTLVFMEPKPWRGFYRSKLLKD